jgi:hypothetical protein
VTVTNVNEAPSITSVPRQRGGEHHGRQTVTASDPDAGTTLHLSIVGGADAARFTINSSTGALQLRRRAELRGARRRGADNVYDVQVQVSDGTLTATQAIA